uniref:Tripartite motif-containing protein 2 n=1 Tax=Magallana gigas TaxID=29159 RepID=K1PAA7_MAGGI
MFFVDNKSNNLRDIDSMRISVGNLYHSIQLVKEKPPFLFIRWIPATMPRTWSVLEDIYKTNKTGIEKDAEEIEKVIAPTYEEMRNELIKQIESLNGDYEKITIVISEQGVKWHTEVERVINKMKNEITEIKEKHRDILEKHLNEIKQIEFLIKENVSTLKDLEESKDVTVIVNYRTKIKEFRKMPFKVHVTLPTFCPKPINRDQVCEMFGTLKPLVSTINEDGYTNELPEDSSGELIDIPDFINTFNTGYNNLRCVSFHTEEEIWTSAGSGIIIKSFTTSGNCMNTIKTKQGVYPDDIAVTSAGDLVYCDRISKTLNQVKDGKIEEIIVFQRWKPINLCVSSTGDLLVVLSYDDRTQSKVARYSGSIEKQAIQFDDEGNHLYSSSFSMKYIAENENLDICVADWGAGAVVVVNQDGKLRWRYTGLPSEAKKNPFKPRGITTNSQSQILTADCKNHCIHILDQDGQFLHYIENVKDPYGLCVDNHDNLYVAEWTGDVKVIKYLK